MKYCFDIDNTICSGGVPYEEAKPFPKVVKRINELYDEGHHIIISTSRGHWSGENWLEFTKKQLDEWGVNITKYKWDRSQVLMYSLTTNLYRK